MKSILMIGMGKFGHHLCKNLCEMGNQVMIVDMDEKKLEYFNSVFESYEASKYVEMNKKVWNSKKTANATELPVSFETVFNELVK